MNGRAHRSLARPLLGRTALAGALGFALLAGVAPAGLADVSVSGTLATPTVVTTRTHFILYYLQLHSAANQELFAVQMTPPPFATVGGLPEGQSIDGPVDIALQGPGTLGDTVQTPSSITPCSSRTSAFHGYATGVASVDVLLPPDSNTTLAVRYDTGRRAPWVDSDFRLLFTVEPFLVGTYAAGSPFAAGATVTTPYAITTTAPLVGSKTGAHILLHTSPGQPLSTPYAPKTIGTSTVVEISGRLLPAKPGRRIILQWAHAGGSLRQLAVVATNAQGRFAATAWRPGTPGSYELWASYPAQPGGLIADGTSCPLRFTVR
ncbi:MAG: hypothetical protein ABSG64_08785 [Solirubrobacteraceae bacterium]|jgi:hypothetical protein